jgi:hypothetical protein
MTSELSSLQVAFTEETPLSKPPAIPPARKFLERRTTVIVVILTCLAAAIIAIVIAGVLYSQNQQQASFISALPVVWQIQAPLSDGSPFVAQQGFVMMSPEYFYTLAFGNDLVLFQTTTLGGHIAWFAGSNNNSSSTDVVSLSKVEKLYLQNFLEYQHMLQKEDTKTVTSRDFVPNRYLQFDSNGILSIRDLSSQAILWQSSQQNNPTGTYSLQILDNGQLQIVSSTGTVVWAVNQTTPSGTSNAYSYPGNRQLTPGLTLVNDNYTFTWSSQSGQFFTYQKGSTKPLWASAVSQTGSGPYLSTYTLYGNLLISDSLYNTLWASDTASLIPPAVSNGASTYLLQLQKNGNLELQQTGQAYFSTTNDYSNKIYRQNTFPYSKCSPSVWNRASEIQIIIQYTLSDGTIFTLTLDSLGALNLLANNQLVSTTSPIVGSVLMLHGYEDAPTPDLQGTLCLYSDQDLKNPVWTFQGKPLDSPSQLPVTLCFNVNISASAPVLCLIAQNQALLEQASSLNIMYNL